MGFLGVFGKVLLYDASKEYHKIIKDNAVDVIIHAIKAEKKCMPKFGYEFEFHKISLDHENKKVRIDLSGQKDILNSSTYYLQSPFHLSHEYGGWMLEVVHENPFQFKNISPLVDNIKQLYEYLNSKIGLNTVLSLASFPMLGVGNDYYKKDFHWEAKVEEKKEKALEIKEDVTSNNSINNYITSISSDKTADPVKDEENIQSNPYSKSIFLHDEIINRHPRFGNLSRNIRLRRGKKVDIRIPIFKDTNTPMVPTDNEPYPGYVYMDAMGFGMGNCSMQVTLGACSVNSGTYIYDQFLPITPILLALSSGCPIYKGKLTNYDNRFDSICQSVDDRTEEEQNPKSDKYISKSRYGPCYSYISEHKYTNAFNNDAPKFPINNKYYKKFIDNGISPKLSLHFANVLVRDPLVIFSEKIDIDDIKDMSHFENINSTNWNALRFKLPRVSDNDTCFKVEVRPCDLQITPYENTAMIAFILGLYGIITRYDVNFIIPISKVDENFKRAYQNDSINKQKFWWRVNGLKDMKVKTIYEICLNDDIKSDDSNSTITYEEDQENIKELTIDEIVNGSEKYNYPGLMKLIMDAMKEVYKTDTLNEYLKFMSRKATGELWTDAKYIRNFIMNHPKYKHDSIISDEINYDLITTILKIQNGEYTPKEIFGN